MEEYLHSFKGIAKGRGLPPLNPMECGIFFYLVRGSGNKKVQRLWPRPRQKRPMPPDNPPASQEG
jgi:hypothetical protein